MKSRPRKQTVNFQVEWWDLIVEEYHFSFQYSVVWDYGFSQGEYSSTHAWQGELNKFKELLEEGYAAQLAIEEAL